MSVADGQNEWSVAAVPAGGAELWAIGAIRQMLAEPAHSSEPRALCLSRRQSFDQIKLPEPRKRDIETAPAELRRAYSSFYARLAAAS